jgi:hypothetical protein
VAIHVTDDCIELDYNNSCFITIDVCKSLYLGYVLLHNKLLLWKVVSY